MNLQQKARWQHVVLFAAVVGLLSGGMLLAIGISGSETAVAPWWIGAGVIAFSALMGAFAFASLRGAVSQSTLIERLARGAFELPQTAPESLVRLNIRLGSHFGLRIMSPRPPMPQTYGELVAATANRARAGAWIQPGQHHMARATLGRILRRPAESIAWGCNPTDLIPPGRKRSAIWERLRAVAPELPEAKLNPWVENIAIYGFLAGLIAITVPFARHLDSDPPAWLRTIHIDRVVRRALGLLLFGSIIGILMIPVRIVGRKYAARLPAEVDDMGVLASCFARSAGNEGVWTMALVAEHLRDLVSSELGIASSSLREETALFITPHVRRHVQQLPAIDAEFRGMS